MSTLGDQPRDDGPLPVAPDRVLDYRPFEQSSTARERLRAIGGSVTTVIGLIPCVALVVVPLIVLPVQLSGSEVDGGIVVGMVLLLVGGVAGLGATWWWGGVAGELERFAQVNGLTRTSGSRAPGYAGTEFRNGVTVAASVRTAGPDFVEVGERLTSRDVGMRGGRMVAGLSSPNPAMTARVFMRAHLPGGSSRSPADGPDVPPDLGEALRAFGGPTAVEMTADELTVFASKPLKIGDGDRVREAFRLIDTLVVLNAAGTPASHDPTRLSAGRGGRTGRHPAVVVLSVLAMVVVEFVGFVVTMATADTLSNGSDLVVGPTLVVALLVVLVSVFVFFRWLTAPVRRAERADAA